MATPPSPETIDLFKLLDDPDKWYPYFEIKQKIADRVAPGRAIRKYKQRLKESRAQHNSQQTDIPRTDSEMIRLGAMACAQIALTTWKGKGIMVRGEGQFKEIRLKPGFQTWGVVSEAQQAASAAAEAEEEAADMAQETAVEPQGSTEVPRGDSVPSEAPPSAAEAVSEPVAEEPAAAVVEEPAGEPVVEASPAEVDLTVEEKPADDFVAQASAADDSSPMVSVYEVAECPDCGMGIVNVPVHEEWHQQLRRVTATSGSAFVDPEMLRTLVEGVMRQALTRFQVNMQDWLEGQFAELERHIRLGGRPEKVRSPWAE